MTGATSSRSIAQSPSRTSQQGSPNPFLLRTDTSTSSSYGHFTVSFRQRSLVERFKDFIEDMKRINGSNKRRRVRRRSSAGQSATSSFEPKSETWEFADGSFTTSTPSSSTSQQAGKRRRVTFVLSPQITDIGPRSHYPATPHPGIRGARHYSAIISSDSGNFLSNLNLYNTFSILVQPPLANPAVNSDGLIILLCLALAGDSYSVNNVDQFIINL